MLYGKLNIKKILVINFLLDIFKKNKIFINI